MIHFTPKHSQSLDIVVSDLNRQAFFKAIVFRQAIGRERFSVSALLRPWINWPPATVILVISLPLFQTKLHRDTYRVVLFASLFTLCLDLRFILP